MKKKIFVSIVAVVLFAVAMTSNLNVKQDNLAVENAEAYASGLTTVACSKGTVKCDLDANNEFGKKWENLKVQL